MAEDLAIQKGNRVRKDYEEKRVHANLYAFYNWLWDDKREKRRIYNKKYYQEHRKMILDKKRRPVSYKLRKVQQCIYECENCPFDDCNLVIYENRKEYMDLYYQTFRDELLKKKAEYRLNHRVYLANSSKLNNYRKKGYDMWNCTLVSTNAPLSLGLINGSGILCIIKINGKNYFSFITDDRENSRRGKIMEEKVMLSGNEKNIIYTVEEGFYYKFRIYNKEQQGIG